MRFEAHLPRLGAALLLTLFAAGAARAQAVTVTTNETLPFTNTMPNPCNGDIVTFSGDIHVVNHFTTDAGGGTHVKTHGNYQSVSGTGTPSGAQYRVVTTSNETINDNDGPQTEVSSVQVLNLISQGSGPNFRLRIVFHITINANGTTTSQVEESSIECRGQPTP